MTTLTVVLATALAVLVPCAVFTVRGLYQSLDESMRRRGE